METFRSILGNVILIFLIEPVRLLNEFLLGVVLWLMTKEQRAKYDAMMEEKNHG